MVIWHYIRYRGGTRGKRPAVKQGNEEETIYDAEGEKSGEKGEEGIRQARNQELVRTVRSEISAADDDRPVGLVGFVRY